VLHLVNEGTQVVLGVGQCGSLHLARIANSPLKLKPWKRVPAFKMPGFSNLPLETPSLAAEFACNDGYPACTVVWTDLGCTTDSSGTATDTSLINFKCATCP